MGHCSTHKAWKVMCQKAGVFWNKGFTLAPDSASVLKIQYQYDWQPPILIGAIRKEISPSIM